ncbi:MAG: hypothetical protein U1E62_07020 [Alsobacter sp.]
MMLTDDAKHLIETELREMIQRVNRGIHPQDETALLKAMEQSGHVDALKQAMAEGVTDMLRRQQSQGDWA